VCCTSRLDRLSIPGEGFFAPVRRFIDENLVSGRSWWYVIMFGLLIVFFTYFYTAISSTRRASPT
jgi:preprotein translocase subunit SecY